MKLVLAMLLMLSALSRAATENIAEQDMANIVQFLPPGEYAGFSNGEIPAKVCKVTVQYDSANSVYTMVLFPKRAGDLVAIEQITLSKFMYCTYIKNKFMTCRSPYKKKGQLNEDLRISKDASGYAINFEADMNKSFVKASCFGAKPVPN